MQTPICFFYFCPCLLCKRLLTNNVAFVHSDNIYKNRNRNRAGACPAIHFTLYCPNPPYPFSFFFPPLPPPPPTNPYHQITQPAPLHHPTRTDSTSNQLTNQSINPAVPQIHPHRPPHCHPHPYECDSTAHRHTSPDGYPPRFSCVALLPPPPPSAP